MSENIPAVGAFADLPADTQRELEAAAFRRLLQHLRDHPEVQNIDLMRLADFCRNCLGKWLAAAAAERGVELDKEAAREAVYGMSYAAWKQQHQRPAGPPPEPTPLMAVLRYRDAHAGIDFLQRAFGFAVHMQIDGEAGIVEHAQLTCGNAMIMVGSVRDDAWGQLEGGADPSRPSPQALYMVVEQVDAHCAKARAAGAEVVQEPADMPYGGRQYACRDPEGHLWSFGSYNPWALNPA